MDSMNSFFSWPMVATVVVIYYGTLVFYRLFLHPLARVPGPKLAAISRWYEGYYDVVQGGRYTAKLAQLHNDYGPIVRISPHELHINDPAFYEKLYRQDGRWDKHAWVYDAFGLKGSTAFTVDHHVHKARRHSIAPFFSKPKVSARQDIIGKNVDKLVTRVSSLAGTTATFNLGAAISAYTRDVANEFVTGKTYNELDLDDFGVSFSISSQGAGVFWRTTKFIRWFGPFQRAIPIDWALKMASDGSKSFLRFLQQSEQDSNDALAVATSLSASQESNTGAPNTVIQAIVRSDLHPSEKTPKRVFEEIFTVTAAAYETTANTLRLILYHVFSDPQIRTRLHAEITSASSTSATTSSPDGCTSIPLTTLEHLPYLIAVLNEGLRLSPGIGTRSGRVSNKDLFYGDWRIPAGTPVGMTTLLLHTDERVYPDPMRFDPDRWLHSGTGKTDKPVFAPFSRGTRVCLGMHLAWAEMYLLLATLVERFDFAFEGVCAADFEFEKDNFGIGTKAGCNLIARATVRG